MQYIKTEKFMAFKRPEFREVSAGYDTIGEVIEQNCDGLNVRIGATGFEFFATCEVLPIGNDELRHQFGLPPFADVWPADQPRSAVPPEYAYCHIPELRMRPGTDWHETAFTPHAGLDAIREEFHETDRV